MEILRTVRSLSPAQRQDLLAELTAMVLPRRLARMDAVLGRRTRRVQVLFEDVYHPHNASAVIRSTECFGVQDVHVVEREYRFRPSTDVVRGAGRWITLHRHADLAAALADLSGRGYRVAATSVLPGSVDLDAAPVDRPLVLCFGTEEVGLSDAALAAADLHLHVPMAGFTESLNVSVTAALCLRELTRRIRQTDGWQLSADERDELRLGWLMQEGTKARGLTAQRLREWGVAGTAADAWR
ncbi:MAG: RNA methyltransferase [Candidatus Krumholzibacteriia bacterium]